jgi:polyisoprenoid-binding protein YceI
VKRTAILSGGSRGAHHRGVATAAIFALCATAFPLAFHSLPALAAPVTYEIDAVHSEVSFKIRHLVSNVRGRFNDFEGTIIYDAENPAASSVQVTIDAASIDTANEKRDDHLRSPDFFDVEKFPTLTFSSKEVKVDGDRLLVSGELTMHGVTKPLTLSVEKLGMGGMGEKKIVGFSAASELDRKEYGIVWNRTLEVGGALLGNDVAIEIGVEAAHDTSKSEAAKKNEPPKAEASKEKKGGW